MSIHLYEKDVRNPPDADRKKRFKIGWQRAVAGRDYVPKTLEDLTWDNMGWRMGKLHGEASAQVIEAFFEVEATLWREKNNAD